MRAGRSPANLGLRAVCQVSAIATATQPHAVPTNTVKRAASQTGKDQ